MSSGVEASPGKKDIDKVKAFVESFGILAPIAYGLFYIAITLLGISAAAFTILAGVIFGTFKGLIIVVIAATIAATIAFFISRYFKDKFFSNKNKKTDEGFMKKMIEKIEDNCEKRGFATIAILRLSFLPYMPLSYASGLVKKLKATDFILATFLTNIFGSFVFIFLGASITESIPLFLGAIILLILFLQVPKIIKKFEKKNS